MNAVITIQSGFGKGCEVMSMISEQINLLRDAAIRLQTLDLPNTAKEVKEAADTIEELSAKLASANMERSTAYYNDGWIPCSERLPENKDLCWLTNVWSDGTRHVTYDFYIKGGGWYDTVSDSVLAWMPINKPAPYKPKGEK